MLLTFNVLLDKLLDKSKTQTIRANYPLWQDRARKVRLGRGSSVLSIWWRNPRTMRFNKDCYKIGTATWKVEEFEILSGMEFTQDTAMRDGFNDVAQLVTALQERSDLGYKAVMMASWAVIRWEWVDGPYPMPRIEGADLITLEDPV